MRNFIRWVSLPAAISRTNENDIVARSQTIYTCVSLDQFFVPPPNRLVGHAVFAWCLIPIIPTIEHHGEVELFEVAQALGLNGGLLRSGERGQQHRSQNGNDGNYN